MTRPSFGISMTLLLIQRSMLGNHGRAKEDTYAEVNQNAVEKAKVKVATEDTDDGGRVEEKVRLM